MGKKAGLLIAAAFLFGLLSASYSPVSAYTVPNQASASIASGAAQTQPLTVANAGDTIVVTSQMHGNTGNSTGLPFSTISDSFGDSYPQNKQVGGTFQGLLNQCGNACGVVQFYVGTAKSSGMDNITITPNPATSGPTVNGAFEAFDVIGVIANIDQNDLPGTIYTGTAITALNGPFGLTLNGANSFAVGSYMTSCTNGHVFSAGTGFTMQIAGGSNWGGAEYGTPTTGPALSPTVFPVTCAIAVSNWVELGIVLEADKIAVTPCNFNQLQCWWYPMLFYGVYAGAFMVVGAKGQVGSRGLTFMLLAALTICSLIQVQMGMMNLLMPVGLTLASILYAVRSG